MKQVINTTPLPIGSIVVPCCGLYLGSDKETPKKELLWSLWVVPTLLLSSCHVSSADGDLEPRSKGWAL